MKNKVRYQIFLSSTFRDLVEERKAVVDVILRKGHIPVGMELFPSEDSDAWEIIQRSIEESDIYLLITAGMYGSQLRGVSYTEREFNYAAELGKPIVFFPHGNPGKLFADNIESDPKAKDKLAKFIKKAQKGRHRRTWKDIGTLMAEVNYGIDAIIRTKPLVGWVRADGIDDTELLKKLVEAQETVQALSEENSRLKERLEDSQTIEGAGDIDEQFSVNLLQKGYDFDRGTVYSKFGAKKSSIRELFLAIAPNILRSRPQSALADFLGETLGGIEELCVPDESMLEIKSLMIANRLIRIEEHRTTWTNGDRSGTTLEDGWIITASGERLWLRHQVAKRSKGQSA